MVVFPVPYVHVFNNPARPRTVCYGPKVQTDFWLLSTKHTTNFLAEFEGIEQEEKYHNVFHFPRTVASEFVKVKGQVLNKHQKTVKLMSEFVSRYTVRSDWVCDPFMGSGTTGVAALKLGRYFLGSDCDPRMVPGVQRRFSHEGFNEYI